MLAPAWHTPPMHSSSTVQASWPSHLLRFGLGMAWQPISIAEGVDARAALAALGRAAALAHAGGAGLALGAGVAVVAGAEVGRVGAAVVGRAAVGRARVAVVAGLDVARQALERAAHDLGRGRRAERAAVVVEVEDDVVLEIRDAQRGARIARHVLAAGHVAGHLHDALGAGQPGGGDGEDDGRAGQDRHRRLGRCHVGRERGGAEAVELDPVDLRLLQRLGEVDQRGLGRGVGREVEAVAGADGARAAALVDAALAIELVAHRPLHARLEPHLVAGQHDAGAEIVDRVHLQDDVLAVGQVVDERLGAGRDGVAGLVADGHGEVGRAHEGAAAVRVGVADERAGDGREALLAGRLLLQAGDDAADLRALRHEAGERDQRRHAEDVARLALDDLDGVGDRLAVRLLQHVVVDDLGQREGGARLARARVLAQHALADAELRAVVDVAVEAVVGAARARRTEPDDGRQGEAERGLELGHQGGLRFSRGRIRRGPDRGSFKASGRARSGHRSAASGGEPPRSCHTPPRSA
ncbi:MAG: hypothetical protein U1F43_10325 [Myxococcota bacterium]